MKEPFVPSTTISQMLPYSLRREFFRRVLFPNGKKMRVPDRERALEMTTVRNHAGPEHQGTSKMLPYR